MDPDRWQRTKELFGSALAREPADRGAFLAQVCGGDETLRQELESLVPPQVPAQRIPCQGAGSDHTS